MQIFVEPRPTLVIDCDPTDTIGDLARQVGEKKGYPPGTTGLIVHGRWYYEHNWNSLSSLGLAQDSSVYAMIAPSEYMALQRRKAEKKRQKAKQEELERWEKPIKKYKTKTLEK